METSNPGFFKRYGLILFLLLLLVIAVSAVLLLSNTAKPKASQMTQATPSVSPTSAPLTTQNAEPTLTQMDQNMQSTMNQVDTDLKDVNNIDTTQDSTAGL